MPYRIERSPRFLADVEAFGAYCKAYKAEFAARQFDRLDYAIRVLIGESPSRWSPFIHTGHPRLIPLTQVRLYVVAGSHWVAPRFSSDFRV